MEFPGRSPLVRMSESFGTEARSSLPKRSITVLFLWSHSLKSQQQVRSYCTPSSNMSLPLCTIRCVSTPVFKVLWALTHQPPLHPPPLHTSSAAYLILRRQVWWVWQRRPCSPLDQRAAVMAVWRSPVLRWCNLTSRTANISDWALRLEFTC